jgi:hypothetical protein
LFPAPGPTNATDVVFLSFLRKLFRYEILLISILRADGNFIDKICIVSLVQIILTDPTPTLKQASAARIVAPIMFF